MKNFFEDHHVTPKEIEQLKAKLLGTFFTHDQWYNRHRGATALTKAELRLMEITLDEIRVKNNK